MSTCAPAGSLTTCKSPVVGFLPFAVVVGGGTGALAAFASASGGVGTAVASAAGWVGASPVGGVWLAGGFSCSDCFAASIACFACSIACCTSCCCRDSARFFALCRTMPKIPAIITTTATAPMTNFPAPLEPPDAGLGATVLGGGGGATGGVVF